MAVPTLTIFGITIIFGLLAWLIIIMLKEEEQQYEDAFLINLYSNKTSPIAGFGIGMVKNKVSSHDGRVVVTFSPRDVDKILLKDKKQIPDVTIVYDKNKFIEMPKHTLSDRRTIYFGYPPTPEEFSPGLKAHPFGKMLMEITEKINTDNVETAIVREGSQRKTDMLHKMGDGEVSEAMVEKIEEIVKVVLKNVEKDLSRPQPPSNYRPPQPSGQF